MREIKFRAWDTVEKRMYYAGDCEFSLDFFGKLYDDEYFLENGVTKNIDYRSKLMQYTGLKDKNGVEIYEGDIVSGSFGIPPINITSIVEFEDSCFQIITESHNPKSATVKEAIECLDIEVIGNIYENKELLNG